MTVFNRLYFFNNPQHVDKQSVITIQPAAPEGWLRWTVSLPKKIGFFLVASADTVYSTAKLARSKFEDLHATLCAHYVQGNAIHRMDLPLKHFHLVSSAQIAEKIARFPRWDVNGLFADTNDDQLIFFPLLKDLVGDIDREKFLFTCHAPHVAHFRRPILAFMDSRNKENLREKINEEIEVILSELEAREENGVVSCAAQEITSTFAVASSANLLFGRSAPFTENKGIADAISICLKHSFVTLIWGKADAELQTSYEQALAILRGTVAAAQGKFLDSLQQDGMDKQEIEVMFYLMYFAGVENSSSVLQYMLWQMGQHKEYQAEIFRELIGPEQTRPRSEKAKNALRECLRLHPAVSFFGRNPRSDLEIRVENKDHPSWSYRVPKGHNIICSSYLASRDSAVYPEPDTFNPERENISNMSWSPFGSGMHACPGRWFAEEQIRSFTEALIKRYEISSTPDKVKQKGFGLLQLEPAIQLTLKRRSTAIEQQGIEHKEDSQG